MSVVSLLVVVLVVGLIVWIFNAYVPLPSPLKIAFNILVAIVLVCILLQFLGLLNLGHVGHLRGCR